MSLNWVEWTQSPGVCARLTVYSQVQGQVSSPSSFLLSEQHGSERHRARVKISRQTWVGSPHRYFRSSRLPRRIASAMPILSHNISCNAKYFVQPSDLPQAVVLDWDEENLPEQTVEAGSFDIILYVSNSSFGYLTEHTIFQSGWQT